MTTAEDRLRGYESNSENAEALKQVEQLIDSNDVEGMINLIMNPDTDPCLKILAWSKSQKNLDLLKEVHATVHSTVFEAIINL